MCDHLYKTTEAIINTGTRRQISMVTPFMAKKVAANDTLGSVGEKERRKRER